MSKDLPESKTSLPSYLKELEDLEKEATPGSWIIKEWNLKRGLIVDPVNDIAIAEFFSGTVGQGENDCDFINDLRNNFPRILEEYKQLQKERAWSKVAREALSGVAKGGPDYMEEKDPRLGWCMDRARSALKKREEIFANTHAGCKQPIIGEEE